jgi:hypothetical protein
MYRRADLDAPYGHGSMQLLQHYTSAAGLEGIARSKSLWATSFLELNDEREMEYGHVEITKRALRESLSIIDRHTLPEYPRAELDFGKAEKQITEQFKRSFDGPKGSERLFVCSFAKAQNEDQESRGIYTIWHRYTGMKGYCLQFDRQEIVGLLEREASRRHYALLELATVRYGIDEAENGYLELRYQLVQHLLNEVHRAKAGLGLKPDYEGMWPLPTFAHRMLRFYASTKDPSLVDEREVRIMAVPAKEAMARPFTGILAVTPVKTMSNGRDYIDIGAGWLPGIEPKRIIIGPQAEKNIDSALAHFNRRPEVSQAHFAMRSV